MVVAGGPGGAARAGIGSTSDVAVGFPIAGGPIPLWDESDRLFRQHAGAAGGSGWDPTVADVPAAVRQRSLGRLRALWTSPSSCWSSGPIRSAPDPSSRWCRCCWPSGTTIPAPRCDSVISEVTVADRYHTARMDLAVSMAGSGSPTPVRPAGIGVTVSSAPTCSIRHR